MDIAGYEVHEDTVVAEAMRFRALAEDVGQGQQYLENHVHLKGVEKGVIYRQADDMVQQIAHEMDAALKHLRALSSATSQALSATLDQYRRADENALLDFQIDVPNGYQRGA